MHRRTNFCICSNITDDMCVLAERKSAMIRAEGGGKMTMSKRKNDEFDLETRDDAPHGNTSGGMTLIILGVVLFMVIAGGPLLGAFFGGLGGLFGTVFGGIGGAIGSVAGGIGSAIGGIAGGLGGLLGAIFGLIGGILGAVFSIVGVVLGLVGSIIGLVFGLIGGLIGLLAAFIPLVLLAFGAYLLLGGQVPQSKKQQARAAARLAEKNKRKNDDLYLSEEEEEVRTLGELIDEEPDPRLRS